MENPGQRMPVIVELDNVPARKSERTAFYRQETKYVLATRFNMPEQVNHSETGAPLLSSGFISISHSEQFLAILLSDLPCGVDIQVRDRKLNKGKDWFYNEQERQLFGDEPSEDELYRIWCAKEAFFKLKQGKIDDLRSDVSVAQFQLGKAIILFEKKEYPVELYSDNRYQLAYCFEPEND